ncbi:DEAD/DEAH box helicase [Erysipelothrix larvae]|uniref:ATP-dependent RNA helicase CshA n=1 Tax=Erysipelothrix larvae TaxID=1514105 RepID=A0A0X8H035_9FIRM|nr:DEAD/DEAH box helicase [Erysipelothrix larvae]AMC93624.1 DEAD/DEAH box helicase [Erysipelothrix larvae]
MEFYDLGIIPEITEALDEEGYETPTPIQEKTIPAALEGRDVLGLAQTGTGKTCAFAVPTLQRLAKRLQHGKNRKIRALVLTPTRELGVQVNDSFRVYGRYLPLRSTVVFGGVNQGRQVNALRSGIDILVATPGRLIDLMNQGYIDLSHLEIFILDEADRMLDMGFIHDIRKILKSLPAQKQTLFFSATMPKEVTEIVDRLLSNPVQVSVAPVSSTVDTVNQSVQYVDQIHKIDLLEKLAKEIPQPMLVFTRTKRGADRVTKDLLRRGISAQAIHGNKSQSARQLALDNFKNYDTQVLVATDIAARGIDINELNYVVNFDMPEVPETYVHRIGRTGRAGHSGNSISYVNYREIPLLKDIEKLINKNLTVLENEKYPIEDKSEKPKQKQRVKKAPAQKKPKHNPRSKVSQEHSEKPDRPQRTRKKSDSKSKWEAKPPRDSKSKTTPKKKSRSNAASSKNETWSNKGKSNKNKQSTHGRRNRNYGSKKAK